MAKFSTGLRNTMLATGSLKSVMDGTVMRLYSGTPPASADAPVTGTLLATLSVNGNGAGVTFETIPADGVLAKEPAEVWQGTNAATGTVAYARLVAPADTGNTSTTANRIQVTVGNTNTDILVANTLLTSGQTFTLNYFNVELPTL